VDNREQAPPAGVDGDMDQPILPRTIIGYVIRSSGVHQLGLAALSAAVFGLSAVPLELQRRIVNDAIKSGATRTILWLAAAYAAVALLEQSLKLALNVYRAWVSENAVRTLRQSIHDAGGDGHGDSPETAADSEQIGTRTAMVVAEAEPIGGFVGMAISEPLLQAGILVSVIGYMTFLEPWTLVLCVAFLLPQMLFVPLMQHAINRRAGARITTLRQVSGGIIDTGAPADEGIERVFTLNMGIYKIKYTMNLAMNLMYHLAVAVALGVGGWFAVSGRIEVGTVVAVVSGLGKLNDPWGDLVSWARQWSVDSVKYRLFADAVNGKGLATA
jgi:ABC-type multidrug transport system fused ATPase/permease subunit